ncbi:hypothetical protein L6452_19591 [Arctium lappa]|uniref:Uncharacterized protein n=1 Tax=Arctium lappa TaxID=4217 RepID=A0ACB9B874_ARCLA|nr:hypothetical protein L6452_19591 [Arctium lappa]
MLETQPSNSPTVDASKLPFTLPSSSKLPSKFQVSVTASNNFFQRNRRSHLLQEPLRLHHHRQTLKST